MAELMGDEVVRDVGGAEEDQPGCCVPVEAPEPGQAEEPRGDHEPDASDPNGPWPPVEAIESLLGDDEPIVRSPACSEPH